MNVYVNITITSDISSLSGLFTNKAFDRVALKVRVQTNASKISGNLIC